MAVTITGEFKPADPMGLYKGRGNPLTQAQAPGRPSPFGSLEGNPENNFDTPLTAAEEKAFQAWKAKYAPDDSGEDYDLRGAFKAGATPDEKTSHFVDTFKKPNHPTFSDQSRYARYAPEWAGTWDEAGNYKPSEARARAEAEAQAQAQTAAAEGAYGQLEAKKPGRYQLIDASTYEQWKAEWDSANRSTGLVGDTIKLLDAGTAELEQSINEMIGMIPGIGKSLQGLADAFDKFAYGSDSYSERLADIIDRDIATLTPETEQARGEQWWNAETNTLGSAWLNPRSYFAGVVESLPSTLATMAPSMWLARGAFLGALAKGATEKVAAAAAAKTALLAGAVTEGGLGGAQASLAVRQSIERMPREKILETEAAQALISQGMTPEAALEALTTDATTQAFLLGGVATGLFGGFGDRFLAKLVAEGVGGGIARRIVEGAVRGVVAEGLLEELPQEGLGQLAQNVALQNTVDPGQDLLEGVPNAALGGAAIGAAMGGALGGVGGAVRPAETGDVAAAPVASQVRPQGPLATAVEHGLASAIPAAVETLPPTGPIGAQTEVLPDAEPVPVTPVTLADRPYEGESVVVEAEGLPRFTGKVMGYEQTETGDVEALVVDENGELLQVPLETLRTAKLTDQAIADMDARDNPPIEREPADLEPSSSRIVGKQQVQFPDVQHAELYDFGKQLQIAKGHTRTQGGDPLKAREIDPEGRALIADRFGVLPERVNEIADDYRYRVDHAARGSTGKNLPSAGKNLPITMHGLFPDKLKIWRQERQIAELKGATPAQNAQVPASDQGVSATQAVNDATIDDPAHAAATSPLNDLPEPTQAQKEAGNYKLGHFVTGGLDISIENPAGSERKGIDKGGKAWSVTMKSHYGYIKGTVGRDKDHIDVFVKKGTAELGDDAAVFVVDQHNAEGNFDEHKVMLGYATKGQASNAYKANYTKGWKGLGSITETTLGEFKGWLKEADTSKPFGSLTPSKDVPVAAADASEAAYEAALDYGAAGPGPADGKSMPPVISLEKSDDDYSLVEDALIQTVQIVGGRDDRMVALVRRDLPNKDFLQAVGELLGHGGVSGGGVAGPRWSTTSRGAKVEITIYRKDGRVMVVLQGARLAAMLRDIFKKTMDEYRLEDAAASSAPAPARPASTQRVSRTRKAPQSERRDDETAPSPSAAPPASTAEPATATEMGAPQSSSPAPADPFANNKLFTADKVAAAKARLKSKMGQLNSGIDPEVLIDGMTIAGAYIESGLRDFAAYAKAMVGDFGDGVKPYLLSFWEGARNYPGLDTKGMTPVAEAARLHADLNTVLPKEAAPALGQELARPKKRTPKAGSAGDRTLIQDFGVDHIDGWTGDGEATDFGIKGGVKDNFLNDAAAYLRAVATILQDKGYTPSDDAKGRPMKAVNKSEGGPAVSGDVSMTLWHPESEARLYVNITGSSLRGMIPSTKSGISVMFRAAGKGADRYATRGGNQWAPVDLSAAELAGMLRDHVSRIVRWSKEGVSASEKQSVIDELRAVIARPPLAPSPETTDEPQELDQPGQGALAGAPADALPAAAGGRDAGQGADGRGGADLSRDVGARVERVPTGRSVPDGPGAVPVSTRRDGDAGAGGAEPDAPGAGGDEGRAARDAARVIEDAATAAATPAQNRPADFTITDEDAIGSGGAKTKFRNNVAAIELLRTLESEARPATRAEQAVLAKWVGWGGLSAAFAREDGTVPKGWEREAAQLKDLLTEAEYRAAASSTRNAHYTSSEVVKAIWSIAQRLGFKGGRVLEPSVGAGNFLGLMPADLRDASQITGVELDGITGGIAKHLYPAAKIHAPRGFQDFSVPDGYFDLAIGNPPFGSEKLYDRDRRHLNGMSIHNYFFAKSIDALRPGGILAMVVTNYFLDVPMSEARRYIAERADLIGAVRLPNDAFLKNAGTEVTTDIVLLRKREDGTTGEQSWKNTGTFVDKGGKSLNLSRYFLDHPDMMLGDFGAFGTMYRADTAALVSRPGQDTAAELDKAIEKLPRDLMSAPGAAVEPETVTVATNVADALVGSVFLSDGTLMVRRTDSLGETRAEPLSLPNEKAVARVAGMVRVRDAFSVLRRAQINEAATDEQIARLRERLNKVYDAFVGEHGPINADANKRLFRNDPTWPQIAALEDKFDKGLSDALAKRTGEQARAPSAQKAAIFTRRTQQPYRPPTEAKSAKDALAAVLAEYGRIDLEQMSRLYGRSADEIIDELGPLIYRTPAGSYETAEAYLSGNVKKKLAEAEIAAAKDATLRRNVEALRDVLPADIEAIDIDVKAGAPWVPARYIVDFLTHVLGAPGSTATYNRYNASWTIDPTRPTAAAEAQWATARAGAGSVVDAALNDKTLSIYDRTSDGKAELNVEETTAAKDKVERVKSEWRRWLWTEDERRATLARIYNDTFNTDVIRRFDGSHLSLPGKVGDDIISLRPHQKSFIWRGMQTATVLADHTVGAGKTFAAIALAMEMRRVGLARKPMFVVPNHLVGQWAADFLKLYPGAKVLATSKGDFEKENRKKLFARVATGDWDAVIVAHSSFGKVPVDPKFEQQFIEQQMRDLDQSAGELRRAEGGKSRTVKQIEKAHANLQAKLQKLLDSGGKDVGMTFEEMGVDALFVDEAHEFKNLGFATKMTRVGGLGNTQGSQKAADLYIKTRSILERTGGRNLVFLTGTPISNTMAELYTVQRYLDYGALAAMGVAHFDAWAKVFGEVVSDWELSPSGTYKLNSRFAKFVNMPELMQRYLSFADVITNDDIKRQLAAQGKTLPLPRVKGGKPTVVVVPRSRDQAAYIGEPVGKDPAGNDTYPQGSLVWRAEHLPKKVEKGSDNMLKVMSDARKAALDMRLIDPSYGDTAGSKVHVAADNMLRLYRQWDAKRGTQLVFIDLSTPKGAVAREEARIRDLMAKAEAGDEAAQEALDNMSPDELLALGSSFSVYDDLKAKLIERGIPAAEIAFIHDANTEAQKEELFGKVRTGRVRLLFGSTPKMGAGTNVQNRLVGLHHLDAPWRPSDLEQRDGRGIRQGNELYAEDPDGFEIEILRYATKNTLDARQWQTIEGKARFVAQLRKGDVKARVVEDIAGEAANAAEMKAAASGNPLILEEMDLRQKLRRLEGQSSEHDREQFRVRDTLRRVRDEATKIRARMEADEADATAAGIALETGLPTTIDGEAVEKPGQLGAAVLAAARRMLEAKALDPAEIGALGQFKLRLEAVPRQGSPAQFALTLAAVADREHDMMLEDVTKAHDVGTGTAIMNMLRSLTREPKSRRERLAQLERDLPALEAQIRPWPDAATLESTRVRHAEVLNQLKPKQQAPAATVAPARAEPSIAPEPAIVLTGTELGDARDIPALRRAALRWYTDTLVGEAAKTADGLTVLFNRAGAKETTAGVSNPTLLQAIPAIRSIIEKGRVVRREKPTRPTKADTSRETIGGRLAAIREARGMPQATLAAELGLSPQRYGAYERGRALPPPEVLDKLFDLTGATSDYVLFGRGRGLPADLLEAMNAHRPDVRERIVIAAPVRVGDRVFNLAVTVHATDDGKFAYDLAPHSAPGDADLVADSEGAAINLLEVPSGWGDIEGGPDAPVAISSADRAELDRIVREVSGLSETQFHARIALPNGAPGWGSSAPTTAAGYYDPVADIIALAEDSAATRTAYHESFHRLQRLFLSEAERAILKADLPRLRRIVRANEFRRTQVEGMSAKEVEAEAFAIYAAGKAAMPLHKGIRAAWDRLAAIVRRVRNFLTGSGFLTSEDVFDAARRGDIAGRAPAVTETAGQTVFSVADAPRSAAAVRERAIDELKGKLTDIQPALLAAVPLTYFPELAQRGMSAIDSYLRTKREMDAYRGKKHAAADELAQDWLKYTRLGFGLLPSKEGTAKAAELAALMHDATLAGIDPSSTEKEMTLKYGYEGLRRRYMSLAPSGRALFTEVRDAYVMQQIELDKLIIEAVRKAQVVAARRADERYQAEMARIAKSGLIGEALRRAEEDASSSYANAKIRSTYANKARLTSLRKSFENNRVPAPYFPLARFGRYTVTVRNIDGTVLSFSRRETAADRNRLARDMREAFPAANVEVGVMDEAGAGLRDAMDPRLVAEIEGILNGAGVDGTVMDQIWQRYLQTMPDLSTRKRFIHRKGTAGFEGDALRAFSSHMFHAAHQMGRLKYGVDLQELLDETAVQARKSADPTKGTTLANELGRRHKWIMNPQGSSLAQAVTSAMFVWYLAATPAAAIVNLTQTPMLGIPILGARYGLDKAAAAMARASADFVRGKGLAANSRNVTDEERRALDLLYESGLIDRTQSHDLAGVGDTGVNYSPLRARVMAIISWAFHKAEVANREVTALTAFRLARAAGESFMGAVDSAHDLTWKTHFDYANSSRPRLMQNDAAKVLLVFQNYQLNMWYRLMRDLHQSLKGETPQARKEARIQLAGIAGMMTLFGGITGFFGFNVLMAIAGMFLGDDDNPMDLEQQLRGHVVDMFGKDIGGMILNGVPGQLLGIDLTSRIGMPDFFVRAPDDPNLEGRDWMREFIVGALGVVPNTLMNMGDGLSLIQQGKTYRGLELMAPKAIKDLMQAYRFANDGLTTRAGDQIITPDLLGGWSMIAKAIGFTPARVAEAYERNSSLKAAETRVIEHRSVLLNQLAMAIEMDDDAARDQVLERIREFNSRPINQSVAITAETVRRSMAARQRNAMKREDGVLIQNPGLSQALRELLPERVN